MTLAMKIKPALPGGKAKPKVDPVVAKVDRLAEIEATLKTLDPLVKEANEIKAELRGIADTNTPSDEPCSFSGTKFLYSLDPKTNERTVIDMEGVKNKLGKDLFFQIAKIGLADIDKYLSESERAKFIKIERTGSRRGKLVPKA